MNAVKLDLPIPLMLFVFQVLEVMKKCITRIPYSQKLGEVIQDILLRDSSVHNALFRIICTTKQTLEVSYLLILPFLLICLTIKNHCFPS